MNPTIGTEKTLAKKLKGNMGKLLLSTLLLSIIVILLTVTLSVEGRAKSSDSTSNTPSITATISSNLQSEVNTSSSLQSIATHKPSANASLWSHKTLKVGNGSIVIDKGKK